VTTMRNEYSLCTLWTRLEDSPQLDVSKASLKSDLKDVTLSISDDDDCQRNIKNSYLSWRKEANNKLNGPLSFFFFLATSEQWKLAIFCFTKTGGTNSIFNGTHLQNMCSKCLPNSYKLWLEQNTVPTTIPNDTKSWRQLYRYCGLDQFILAPPLSPSCGVNLCDSGLGAYG